MKLKAPFLAAVAALAVQAAAWADTDPSAAVLAHVVSGEDGSDGGLARWGRLCTLVSGLPREPCERMLEHISQIAQEAGVPLAGESCTPNLYLLFTADPRQLLRGMEKKNRAFTFSCGLKMPGTGTSQSTIDELIDTPRAVRVWYNTTMTGADGATVCADRHARLAPHTWASRLSSSVRWNLFSAFVVVDTTRLAGLTQAQIADYLAMVGLVRVNPDARLDSAQTVLRLFEHAPGGGSPAAMTPWDRALLKAVYAGNPDATLRRSQLAQLMIAEAVPQ